MKNKRWWVSVIKFEISVDDGCKLDNRIAKLCQKYDIPCTFYIPIDYITLAINKGYEPLPQASYRWLIDNFEIGSHGVTHRYLTQIPFAEAKDEIRASKQMLENLIGRPVTKFCYPRGYSNPDIKEEVRKAGYKYARSTTIGHIKEPTDPLFAEATVHIGCPVRPEYEGSTWLKYAEDRLKECRRINQDYIYHAWCHSSEIDKYNEWDNVRKFFKMIGKHNG